MRRHERGTESGQQGFALVLAILTLLVLTVLGLSLVATTSTEQQIAANYKWSQQALYNAEAGLEVGKVLLRDVGGADWSPILPAARGGSWPAASGTLPPTPAPPPNPATGSLVRNYENRACDRFGGGVGYGIVLNDTSAAPLGIVQYQNNVKGQSLNGAFTLWVRHKTLANVTPGFNADDTHNDALILTSEGIAPYTPGGGNTTLSSLARKNAAVRVLEVEMSRGQTAPCPGGYIPQGGEGPTGAGYDPCAGNVNSPVANNGPLSDAYRSQNDSVNEGGSGAAGTGAAKSGA